MENLMEKIMYNVPSDNPKEFIVTLEYAKSQLEESKDAA
jgi:ATP-dependent protease HslVU (ClpYQ) ATPase subunit